MGQAYRGSTAAALMGVMMAACAHEVTLLDTADPARGPVDPVALTVSLLAGPFDQCRLEADGVLHRFAAELREARLFQGVLHPVPPGMSTRWELELVAVDDVREPDSNRWKAAVASAILPFAFVVKLQSDYHLRLEAVLLKDRTLVGSYTGEARIRHRWGPYANKNTANAEGVELAVGTASRALLHAIAADLDRIDRANRTTGRLGGG